MNNLTELLWAMLSAAGLQLGPWADAAVRQAVISAQQEGL